MFEAKLFEDAGKDEFQSALAVGHSREGRVAGLVFEKLLKKQENSMETHRVLRLSTH
jgi:hypothetical protein